MGEISTLEGKILALQKSEEKLKDVAIEVCSTLHSLGMKEWFGKGVIHYFNEGEEGYLLIDIEGGVEFSSRFESLTEAVVAALSDILEKKSETLKQPNRQIRDLRRALRKLS